MFRSRGGAKGGTSLEQPDAHMQGGNGGLNWSLITNHKREIFPEGEKVTIEERQGGQGPCRFREELTHLNVKPNYVLGSLIFTE